MKDMFTGTSSIAMPGAKAPEAAEKKQRCDQSAGQIINLIEAILMARYGINENELGEQPSDDEDGFYLFFGHKQDEGFENPRSHPEFYAGVHAFLVDLDHYDLEPDIRIDMDELVIVAKNKTVLVDALEDYLASDKFKLTTIDDAHIDISLFKEPTNENIQHLMTEMAGFARRIEHEHLDSFEYLFTCAQTKAYLSREHFLATMAASGDADVPVSIQNIRFLIAQEERARGHRVPSALNVRYN